jgi:quercetin dioxygenase-like cupin family protein
MQKSSLETKMPVNTKWLKLPYSFDIQRLKSDLAKINESEWINHVNTSAYNKKWCCIPLYSIDGRTEIITVFDEKAEYKPTKILQRCTYFQEVIDSFKCDKAGVRLMSLAAGDEIKLHVDSYSGYESGVVRIHVPIQTSPQVSFTVDGEPIHFTQGDSWYLNADCLHGVQNPTDSDRIHLLIDCRRNNWLERLFQKAGYKPDEPPIYDCESITDENVDQVIATLEAIGTEAGKKSAERLRAIQTGY